MFFWMSCVVLTTFIKGILYCVVWQVRALCRQTRRCDAFNSWRYVVASVLRGWPSLSLMRNCWCLILRQTASWNSFHCHWSIDRRRWRLKCTTMLSSWLFSENHTSSWNLKYTSSDASNIGQVPHSMQMWINSMVMALCLVRFIPVDLNVMPNQVGQIEWKYWLATPLVLLVSHNTQSY